MPIKKMTRRQALKLSGAITLSISTRLAFPSISFSWSSVWARNTHADFIDTIAYNALSALPFFNSESFPKLEEILEFEGTDALMGSGKGPDRSGASHFSEHYFNPWLDRDKGKGPHSCGKYAQMLYQTIADPQTMFPDSKSAAWAAHFLADMNVPYHVVGCSLKTLKGYIKEGEITLPIEIFGNSGLKYGTVLQSGKDFSTHVKRFLAANKDDSKIDWFDPWYWNGVSDTTAFYDSSHVVWEGIAHINPGDTPYKPSAHRDWHNAVPVFDSPWNAYRQAAESFALLCAKNTRKTLVPRFLKKQTGIHKATDAVYTLWRAAITALDATLKIVWNKEENGYTVSFLVNNMELKKTVLKVQARAAVIRQGHVFRTTEPIEVCPYLKPGQLFEVKDAWTIKDIGPSQYGPYEIRLEVIGDFGDMPDAQYKAVDMKIDTDWPRSYKGKASTSVNVSNSKGKVTCFENTPLKISLDAPTERGIGEIRLKFTSGLWYQYGEKIKPKCEQRTPKSLTIKGEHDGKSVFKIGLPNKKKFTGTFNETEIKAKFSFGGVNRKTKIMKTLSFTLPLVPEEESGETNESSTEEFDAINETAAPDLLENDEGEWNTISDLDDTNEADTQTFSVIESMLTE